MKIFTKIFIGIFCFVVAVVSALSFFMIRNQVNYGEREIIRQITTLGDFLSTQIEIGFIQSQLPYESLSKLTKADTFLFWWIVDNNGIIYRANDTAFMNTKTSEYFPEASNQSKNGQVYLDEKGNYGIYTSTISYGNEQWHFWYGFSTKNIRSMKTSVYLTSLTVIAVSVFILGFLLYSITSYFLKPIGPLSEAVKEISKGNLDVAVAAQSDDEIGDLASAVGQMTVDLKKGKQALEEYNKKLELEVADRTKTLQEKMEELARANKMMVDRELKMVELKHHIEELEQTLGKQP